MKPDQEQERLKRNPFSTPNGYFAETETKILSSTAKTESPAKMQRWIYYAAAACFALLLGLYFFRAREPETSRNAYSQQPDTVGVPASYFSEDELSHALIQSAQPQTAENDQVIEYLIEQEIREDIIISEL